MKEIERVIDSSGILLTKDALEAGISKHLLYSFIKENGFERDTDYTLTIAAKDELTIF